MCLLLIKLYSSSSAQECRTRWRNLRISYLRYLRQSKGPNGKSKKPYYLLSEMNFMEPFVRSGDANESVDTSKISFEVEDHTESRIVYIRNNKPEDDGLEQSRDFTTEILNIKSQQLDDDEDDEEEEEEEQQQQIQHHEEVVNMSPTKINNSVVYETQHHQQQQNPLQLDQNAGSSGGEAVDSLLAELRHPDLAFFRSLLGDIQTMTLSQKAKFKYQVLASLNQILYP